MLIHPYCRCGFLCADMILWEYTGYLKNEALPKQFLPRAIMVFSSKSDHENFRRGNGAAGEI